MNESALKVDAGLAAAGAPNRRYWKANVDNFLCGADQISPHNDLVVAVEAFDSIALAEVW